MEKFRFANPAPANPAKTVEYQGSCKAKALLKFAKDSTADISLATFSKPVANQISTGTGGLAGLATLAGVRGSLKAGLLKRIPGLPEDLFQAPAVWRPGPTNNQADQRETCPACGENSWWRKKEPDTKWICGRCHPPASGLDILWMNKR